MPLPPFDGISNVLPPCQKNGDKITAISPYICDMRELVQRFCTSEARKAILLDLLNFCAVLYQLGIEGFQWLGGSFVENIEVQDRRDPKDIDVVTFVRRPTDSGEMHKLVEGKGIWFSKDVKRSYKIDNFWVHLNTDPDRLVKVSTYWHGFFTHRRDALWKGLVTVSLFDKDEDARAKHYLTSQP